MFLKFIFRASVQATIIHELESHHPEHDLKPNESKTADLEIAVLVQELMAMREDKADLRAQGGHHVFKILESYDSRFSKKDNLL